MDFVISIYEYWRNSIFWWPFVISLILEAAKLIKLKLWDKTEYE